MHESGEMFPETILILGRRKNPVRAVDVAAEMGLSKPSVSRALVKLKDDECKMEHDISGETFDAMKRHLKKKQENSD